MASSGSQRVPSSRQRRNMVGSKAGEPVNSPANAVKLAASGGPSKASSRAPSRSSREGTGKPKTPKPSPPPGPAPGSPGFGEDQPGDPKPGRSPSSNLNASGSSFTRSFKSSQQTLDSRFGYDEVELSKDVMQARSSQADKVEYLLSGCENLVRLLQSKAEQNKDFKKMWRYFDEDKNGALTVNEVKRLCDRYHLNYTSDEVDHLMNAVGQDQNGVIRYKDMARMFYYLNKIEQDEEGRHEGVFGSAQDKIIYINKKKKEEAPEEDITKALELEHLNRHEKAKALKGVDRLLDELDFKFKQYGITSRQLFRMYDADKSGSISVAEFSAALRSLNLDGFKQEMNTLIEHLDVDSDGDIDYHEFCKQFSDQGHGFQKLNVVNAEAQRVKLESRKQPRLVQLARDMSTAASGPAIHTRLMRAFRHVDEAATGFVHMDEFKKCVADLELDPTVRDRCMRSLDNLEPSTDADEDGYVNYLAFEQYLQKTTHRDRTEGNYFMPVAVAKGARKQNMFDGTTTFDHDGERQTRGLLPMLTTASSGSQRLPSAGPSRPHSDVGPSTGRLHSALAGHNAVVPDSDTPHFQPIQDRLVTSNKAGLDSTYGPTPYRTPENRQKILESKLRRMRSNATRVEAAYGHDERKAVVHEEKRKEKIRTENKDYKNHVLVEGLFRDRKVGRDMFSLIRFGTDFSFEY